MKKIILIIDAGHGGNDPVTGRYLTPPHIGKLYRFLDKQGKVELEIREGVTNRIFADKFAKVAQEAGFEVVKVYHPFRDNPMAERCYKANLAYQRALQQGKKAIFLSFHSDAFGMKAQGKGEKPRGISFWTSLGETLSDKIASIWFETLQKRLNEQVKFNGDVVFRRDLSDGDVDWEAGYYVLNGTMMPAVLVENNFFTNRQDAELILDKDYQDAFVKATLEAMEIVERSLF